MMPRTAKTMHQLNSLSSNKPLNKTLILFKSPSLIRPAFAPLLP
jgi:hypothetical protein